ncbi:DUF805 domain-containing protein [Hoeflea sp. WL0058]|uniref:DUF805 domain-containing protein n=1 Tax=Flavimaribacter sediminis TaxID=2865987 RepID=A0AAE2ZNN4_9HYPH|nr:DUF805 domain-containing protein [Flavimaribacter sediminis]MBW8637902.1 DUF805 domain-containing protein [Flavimaribacter sediminis]
MKPDMRWVFLGFSGRLGRLPFLLGYLFVTAVGFVILNQVRLADEDSIRQGTWALLFIAYGVMSVWSVLALVVKRLHDIGFPGPLSIMLFVPFINLGVFLGLCLWPGAAGANAYGDEPNRPKS